MFYFALSSTPGPSDTLRPCRITSQPQRNNSKQQYFPSLPRSCCSACLLLLFLSTLLCTGRPRKKQESCRGSRIIVAPMTSPMLRPCSVKTESTTAAGISPLSCVRGHFGWGYEHEYTKEGGNLKPEGAKNGVQRYLCVFTMGLKNLYVRARFARDCARSWVLDRRTPHTLDNECNMLTRCMGMS